MARLGHGQGRWPRSDPLCPPGIVRREPYTQPPQGDMCPHLAVACACLGMGYLDRLPDTQGPMSGSSPSGLGCTVPGGDYVGIPEAGGLVQTIWGCCEGLRQGGVLEIPDQVGALEIPDQVGVLWGFQIRWSGSGSQTRWGGLGARVTAGLKVGGPGAESAGACVCVSRGSCRGCLHLAHIFMPTCLHQS